jgi:tetratricopeptide (TPR) repeat protein
MASMKSREIKQNILLIFSGIFAAIFICEMGLQLAGVLYSSGKSRRNRVSLNKKADYRILCLGESTTGEGSGNSYPRQMERILSERLNPLQFTIINKGAPGEDTNFILSRLEGYLDKYDPGIVVVMMGINDKMVANETAFYRSQGKDALAALINYLKQLRIVKVLEIFWIKLHEKEVMEHLYFERARYFQERHNYPMAEKALKNALALDHDDADAYLELAKHYYEIKDYPRADEAFDQAVRSFPSISAVYEEAGRYYYERGNFIRAKELYRAVIRLDKDNTLAYVYLAQCCYALGEVNVSEGLFAQARRIGPKDEQVLLEIGNFYLEQKQYIKAEDLFDSLLMLNRLCSHAYIGLGNVFYAQAKFSQAEEMFKKALAVGPKEEGNNLALGEFYENINQPSEAEKIYKKYIKDVRGTDNYTAKTLDNYRKLKQEVLKRGIQLICMQYPRRKLLPLTRIFASNQGIIFVDNERLFEDAVMKGAYEDFFYDRFAGDFGHCTVEGNRLLAGNAAETIIKFVKEDKINRPNN